MTHTILVMLTEEASHPAIPQRFEKAFTLSNMPRKIIGMLIKNFSVRKSDARDAIPRTSE
jgi:hypothetical protein